MRTRQSVLEFLTGPEQLNRRELLWGFVREPPSSACDHQAVVTRATVLLSVHVTHERLGLVFVSPLDVVLDEPKALVLQPDVVFVSPARASIVRDRIWGAPDLVIEVLSPGTRRRDSRDKRRWYRQYGVREYWIIDPILQMIEVIPFCAPRARGRVFRGLQPVASHVLPAFAVPAKEFFK